MPFITKETKNSSFHTKDKLIVASNARSAVLKVLSVSKPTPVQDASSLYSLTGLCTNPQHLQAQ